MGQANHKLAAKTTTRKLPLREQAYLFAHELAQWEGCVLPTQIDRICQSVATQRSSTRGVSRVVRLKIQLAAEWIVNCLIQTEEAIPRPWLAIGLSSDYYKPSGPINGEFGYDIVVNRVIPALDKLGWITIRRGFNDPSKNKSFITRLRAKGALRRAICANLYCWQPLRMLSTGLILLFDGKKKSRHLLPTPNTTTVENWQYWLYEYNQFLSEHAIALAVPDDELKRLAKRISTKDVEFETGERRKPVINYRAVALKRIFARGRLDCGGRFYGGWWQTVPSEYRPYIRINHKTTIEWDFSSMALRLLYALAKVDPPTGDLYDLGITNPALSRPIVKKYIQALLNDENGRFRLTSAQLRSLGVTQSDLHQMVIQRHPIIKSYLKTNIGLQLQFTESEIAFRVMREMMHGHRVPVLPIHDSFLVRTGYGKALEQEMADAFEAVTGQKPEMKRDFPQTHPTFKIPVDTNGMLQVSGNQLDIVDSAYFRYVSTNPYAILD